MVDRLKVYAYNIRFGDAILVEVPEKAKTRYILFDVGNVSFEKGEGTQRADDALLLAAMDDVIARTKGHVDLYVMTHEHMDHVQGLLYASKNGRRLQIDTVWMTASAAPDYYDKDKHPDARKKRLALLKAVRDFTTVLGASQLPLGISSLLSINNARSTKDCVEHIRTAGRAKPHYVHREYKPRRALHPFEETELRILAPEEDTSDYYGPVLSQLAVAAGASGPSTAAGRPLPLQGIDGGAFYKLVDSVEGGLAESLFTIDRAANNTSVVVELTWRGRRLLFTGDAEEKSWRMMAKNAGLRPVDLLKIGHHGSHNATPDPDILDRVLPPARKKEALAVLSTCPNVYDGVPHQPTLDLIDARTHRVYRTTDAPEGKPVVAALDPRR